MNVALWLPPLAGIVGVVVGGVIAIVGNLWKDKLQVRRERDKERRDEQRQLNQRRRERLARLYTQVLSASWKYQMEAWRHVVAGEPVMPGALIEAANELLLEQVPDDLRVAVEDLVKAATKLPDASRREEGVGNMATCHRHVLSLAEQHLAKLDKPVTDGATLSP